MNYRRLMYLWLALIMFSGGGHAQSYRDHQVRSFPISPETTIEVNNKYGKVHVVTWEQDSVRFEIDLRIEANNEQKLRKLKQGISFDFTSNNYYVVAKTIVTKTGGKITEFVDAFVPSNQVTINYLVYIPKDVSLKLENKFGDVFMDDFTGDLELTLSNGDLKANSLTGNTTLRLSSGNGVVNQIGKARIYTSYSDLHVKSSDRLTLDTKSSRITVDEVDYIKINSRRDKYRLMNANEVYGDGNFTTLNVSRLTHELNFSLKYGGVSIDYIRPEFSLVNLNSEYSDIDLIFAPGAKYHLDIIHHNDAMLSYPNRHANVETKDFNVDEKLILTYGTLGTNVGTGAPKVKITANKKCIINLIHK